MTPETILEKKQEVKESQPLQGRRVLVTGGTSGTGLAAAIEIQRLGGEVIIGTRNREHFERAAGNLSGERAYPFIADLTEKNQVEKEIMRLVAENCFPTDLIHSAAGGMEAFLPNIARDLLTLSRIENLQQHEVKIDDLRKKIKAEVEKSYPFAQAINFDGSKALMEKMLNILPQGAKVIYYSSPWSSFYGQVTVPCFYQAIAKTKHMMEEWLVENREWFIGKGIYPAIISGNLILDTKAGRMIDRLILPLLSENKQETIRQSAISIKDMVKATVKILRSDPAEWTTYPLRIWVYGEEGQAKIKEIFPSDNLFMGVEFPI